MLELKGCKKCGGSLYSGCDHYGSYVACLHCGAVIAYLPEGGVPNPTVRSPVMSEGQRLVQQPFAEPAV